MLNPWGPQYAPVRPKSQREVEQDDARYRRSNPGGDDLLTKIVFVVIVAGALAAVVTLFAHMWANRHHASTTSEARSADRGR